MMAGALAGSVAQAEPAPRDSLPPLPPASARRWQTGAVREDRLQHASLSLIVGLGVGVGTREPWAAAAVPGSLGLAKEIADRRGSGFDLGDLAADALGAALAAWITARVD